MLLSVCVACHARTYDLEKVLPSWIECANSSPPVEIVVLDYNSPDNLEPYITSVIEQNILRKGNVMVYKKYTGRVHFHMAHARNLAVLSTVGEIFVMMCADVFLLNNAIFHIRKFLELYRWVKFQNAEGVIAARRDDFIAIGGYDERFELYGPEDKDLSVRLTRAYGRYGLFNGRFNALIPTPDDKRVENYGIQLSKKEMGLRMQDVFFDNLINRAIVVDTENGWGKWN